MRIILIVFTAVLTIFCLASTSLSATYDASGEWIVTITNYWVDQGNSGDCGERVDDEISAIINQTGDSFELIANGKTYQGNISGSTYYGSVSYSEDGGTTYESFSVTLSSENSGSGSGEWYCSDDYYYCSGLYDLSFAKVGGGRDETGEDGRDNSGAGDGGGCFINNIVN
jgi:hypothetical protein